MLVRLLALAPLVSALLLPPDPSAARSSTSVCFPHVPSIVDCIDEPFLSSWQRNGGLPVFGYPVSPALPEEADGDLRTVQHFERNRLEFHPDAPKPYTMLLGRLGAERLTQLGREPAPPVQPAPACRFFPETGHNVCGGFLPYWRGYGLEFGDAGVSERESLALFGLPLTEVHWEVNGAGDRVLTQWFERARLEDHDGAILQGLINVELHAAHEPAPPAPGFVAVAGSKLVQNGHQIFVKGTNYYPSTQPWSHMWTNWDGPLVARELSRARRELGINTVRVLVPYRSYEGWTDGYGNVAPVMLDRLREFVQIAGRHQLKVIITLFDWHDGYLPAGSTYEEHELRYLRTIINAFKDDDRVLAWDLHNEPDNYAAWGKGRTAEVVDWLGRMADAARAIDQYHPITVGVGRLDSLWQAAPDGRTIADISDIISVHSYDAAAYASIATEVRARSPKPIMLEEFGWASGPDCRGTYFDEWSQLYLYRKALAPEVWSELAGMVNWWLQDPPITSSYAVDENGYYGLYRRNGSPKPAIAPFRALRVPALPSITGSDRALTVADVPPRPPEHQPAIFGEDLVIKDEFKYFWTFFGGEATFGRPLTSAYRDEHNTIVQYFERARFELNDAEDTTLDPLWAEGQNAETYLDRVHLTPLGAQAVAGRAFGRVADPQQPRVRYFPETGHTLSGAFRDFWETHGAIFFGPPLTEPFEDLIDGRPTLVQYFTKWRFEVGENGSVRLGSLGVDALQSRQCPRP